MADTPPPAPAPSPAPAPAPAPAAPAKSGTRTVIIILCVLGGLLLLFGGCVVGCTYFVGKKAKEYAEVSQKNPAYATVTMLAAIHPDVEVLSKDVNTGIVKLRNKKTKEETTIDTTKFNETNISEALEQFAKGHGMPEAPATTEESPAEDVTAPPAAPEPEASAEEAPADDKPNAEQLASYADTVKEFPAYLPTYPGATTHEAKSAAAFGMQTFEYIATSTDKPKAVVDFYEKKFKAAGLTIVTKANSTNEHGAVITLVATSASPAGTVSLEAAAAEGNEVRISITSASLAAK